jgi:NTE family protein
LITKVSYRFLLSALFSILFCGNTYAQRIGLVFSGGGASGLAHVGVLKALEENNIPIDFITGTSAGAMIGALYSIGYSAKEIEQLVLSDQFQLMAYGELEREYIFSLRAEDENASMISVPFSKDSLLSKSLPTSLITPALMDYQMLITLGRASASRHDNFDSLFIPFRCVASDITNKKSVIFKNGKLNEVVRASMTFPFYMNPIRIDGNLLFDGGLYNNFPIDVMYHHFDPDFIIGSNVSFNEPPPSDDDVFSHIRTMFMTKTTFQLPCEYGIMIEPDLNLSTFDFNKAEEAIEAGYQAALLQIESIQSSVTRRVSDEELTKKREQFKQTIAPLHISSVNAKHKDNTNSDFVRLSLLNHSKKTILTEPLLKKRFFRMYSTPQIAYVFPTLSLLADSTYALNLKVKKSKDFKLNAGGHFSSRPINTGYLGVSYYSLGKAAFGLNVESYFGKFYGSVKMNIDYHVPTKTPVTIQPYFVMNRWDYFRSFATFFEPVKPSFLIQNELYYGSKFILPLSTTTKTGIDFRLFYLDDSYYQTANFNIGDTADHTYFDGIALKWFIEKNTLNRKQFASEGHSYKLLINYISGREESISGSTSTEVYNIVKEHNWINIQLDVQHFFFNTKVTHTGAHVIGVFNSQSLFKNYTASILSTTAFAPTPDSRTYFMPEYRSPQYVGFGINQIITIKNKFDFRIDAYGYQPFVEITTFDDGTFGYTGNVSPPRFLGSASLIYFSPIGPIRTTLNYFPNQHKPFEFQLSFGYILFNDRAIR